MLNIFFQQPQGLARTTRGLAAEDSRRGDLARPARADAGRGKAGREHARHRRADARGNEGDRDLEPAVRGQRRAVHDHHGRGATRHRPAGGHGGDVHPDRLAPGDEPLSRHQAVPAVHRVRRKASGRVHHPAGAARRADGSVHRAHRRRAGARRRRSRQPLGQHLRPARQRHARQPRPAPHDRAHRLQRRAQLQVAREPGEPGPAADVRAAIRADDRRAARPLSLDQPRRHLAVGPRELPRHEVLVPAGSDARPDQHRAEQHHQDLLDRRGDADAADAGRQHLRHELPLHARARLALRLPASRCC